MYDDRLFFQLAAGLIPAILFGGLVTGAFAPSARISNLPARRRLWILAFITAGVAVTLLAELFAIDLATSPERPSSVKVMVVVSVVVLATAAAGAALLVPWIRALAARRHIGRVAHILVSLGLLLYGIGGLILIDAVVEAQVDFEDQRGACAIRQIEQRAGEWRVDMFEAADAEAARTADLHQLDAELIRLRGESGLSRATRSALRRSLKKRREVTSRRMRAAGEAFGQLLISDPIPGVSPEDLKGGFYDDFEVLARAYGC